MQLDSMNEVSVVKERERVLTPPAPVGSACLPYVCPVTETVDPLGGRPHRPVALRCCFCYQTK